ncbi:MAG: hypothetical protein ACW98Y_20850 [Candidatus Thorarchaeota archaeon]
MPDFGSFSLPDQGRGFRPTRRTGGSTSRPEYVISDQDVPENKCGPICCCMILMVILLFIIDLIPEILFG